VRALLLASLLALFACGSSAAEPTPRPPPGDALDDDDDDPGPPPAWDPALQELPCAATKTRCADEGPHIEGTCCTYGDNLRHIARGSAAEAVDIETDGEYAYLCGGFGVRINHVLDPADPRYVGGAAPRCQRIAIGPVLGDGTRVFWLAHHGDGWVATPFLGTYHLAPSEGDPPAAGITEEHVIADPDVLFEGLAWDAASSTLYAAAHGGGLRVYGTAADGTPTFVRVLDGFDNAWKLDLHEGRGYVVDGTRLHVLDLADPRLPVRLGTLDLPGSGRDVDAHGDRVFVALGGDGIAVFDLASLDPGGLPTALPTVAVDGSAQAVQANDLLLGVASWSHVAVYDRESLLRLGTERTGEYPTFEEDLGVALIGDLVLVAEWRAMHALRFHPGYVSPDIWIPDEMFAFPADEARTKTFAVRNRGPLPLEIGPIATTAPERFTVTPGSAVLAPGESTDLTLAFTPPAPAPSPTLLAIETNDADAGQSPLEIPIVTTESGRLDVGDVLDGAFAFLDPTGARDIENLRGKVTVLAYFALF